MYEVLEILWIPSMASLEALYRDEQQDREELQKALSQVEQQLTDLGQQKLEVTRQLEGEQRDRVAADRMVQTLEKTVERLQTELHGSQEEQRTYAKSLSDVRENTCTN